MNRQVRIWLFTGLLGALGFGLWTAIPNHVLLEMKHPVLLLPVILAFAVAEVLSVEIPTKRGHHTFSATELALVIGLLFVKGKEVGVAAAIAMLVMLIVYRKQRGVQLVFNIAQCFLAANIAALIAHSMSGRLTSPSFSLWVTAIIASAAHAAIGALAVTIAISLAEGTNRWDSLPRVVIYSTINGLTVAAFGILLTWAVTVDRTVLALAIAPVSMTVLAFRLYLNEKQQRQNAEFLYGAVTDLSQQRSVDVGFASVLDSIRNATQATRVELYVSRTDQDTWHRMVRRVDTENTSPAPPQFVSCHPDDVPSTNGLQPPSHRSWTYDRQTVSSICADLVNRDGRSIGRLLISGKTTRNGSFSSAEHRLTAQLADQLAVHMDNSNLAQSLARLATAESELRYQARHDPLTGLANRMFLNELAAQGPPAAVALIDLDEFKNINDTLGHEMGDHVLRVLAERLRRMTPHGWEPLRLGGDEFAVVTSPGMVVTEDDLRWVADQLGDKLVDCEQLNWLSARVGSSVGVAARQPGDQSLDDVLRRADARMYETKRQRKAERATDSRSANAHR